MKSPYPQLPATISRVVRYGLVTPLLLTLCSVSLLADSEEMRLSPDTLVKYNPMGCIANIVNKKDVLVKEGMVMAEKKIGEGTVVSSAAKSVIHQSWTSVLGDKSEYKSNDKSDEFSGTIIDSKSPGKPREIDYTVTYTKLSDNKIGVHVAVTYLADSLWFGKAFYQITLPIAFYADGTVTTQTSRGQDDRVTLTSGDKAVPFKGLFSQVAVMKEKKGVIVETDGECLISINDARQWKQTTLCLSVSPKVTEWKDSYTAALGEKASFDFQITIKSE